MRVSLSGVLRCSLFLQLLSAVRVRLEVLEVAEISACSSLQRVSADGWTGRALQGTGRCDLYQGVRVWPCWMCACKIFTGVEVVVVMMVLMIVAEVVDEVGRGGEWRAVVRARRERVYAG